MFYYWCDKCFQGCGIGHFSQIEYDPYRICPFNTSHGVLQGPWTDVVFLQKVEQWKVNVSALNQKQLMKKSLQSSLEEPTPPSFVATTSSSLVTQGNTGHQQKTYAQYLYIPFDVLDAEANGTKHKYEQKAKTKGNCTIIDASGIATIPSTSTLLIFGHSDIGQARISCQGKIWIMLALAHHLAKVCHLPQEHVRIRLLSCYSACNANGNDSISPKADGACAAKALAYWLGRYDCKQVRVGGYRDSVFTSVVGKRTYINSKTSQPFENTKNSGWVVWYDSDGAKTVKPA